MVNHFRKLIVALTLVLFVFSLFSVSVTAMNEKEATIVSRSIFTYLDGSYDEIIIIQLQTPNNRAVKSGQISRTHYTDDNEAVWKVTLTGTYTYNGVTSSCINAVTNVTFYKPNWVVVSENTSYSGNTATTNVVLGYNVLGTVVPLANVNLSLSCDKDGNLS